MAETQAVVDDVVFAVDVGRLATREERDGGRDILGAAEPAAGDLRASR
ncbi:hypothetical protein SMC26_22830 [Actinomadura fulvescens]